MTTSTPTLTEAAEAVVAWLDRRARDQKRGHVDIDKPLGPLLEALRSALAAATPTQDERPEGFGWTVDERETPVDAEDVCPGSIHGEQGAIPCVCEGIRGLVTAARADGATEERDKREAPSSNGPQTLAERTAFAAGWWAAKAGMTTDQFVAKMRPTSRVEPPEERAPNNPAWLQALNEKGPEAMAQALEDAADPDA